MYILTIYKNIAGIIISDTNTYSFTHGYTDNSEEYDKMEIVRTIGDWFDSTQHDVYYIKAVYNDVEKYFDAKPSKYETHLIHEYNILVMWFDKAIWTKVFDNKILPTMQKYLEDGATNIRVEQINGIKKVIFLTV